MPLLLSLVNTYRHYSTFLTQAAMYGMAQSIPDRSLVGELAWCYLDAVYSTEKTMAIK